MKKIPKQLKYLMQQHRLGNLRTYQYRELADLVDHVFEKELSQ